MTKWNIATYARLRPPRHGHEQAHFMIDRIVPSPRHHRSTSSASSSTANSSNNHQQHTIIQPSITDSSSTTAGSNLRSVISFPPPDTEENRLSLKQRDLLQFQFNEVFDANIPQEEIFNKVCLDLVNSSLDGYNGTILAYGQTGSGKTFTITGGELYGDRGIIPRVLTHLFESFEKKSSTIKYTCYISYLEIYNENLYDLLDKSHANRPIEEWQKVVLMDDDDGDMHFRNLGVYEAISEEEALNLLFLGNMNRVTSDTPMNQASSRSHSIFSIMLEARSRETDVITTSKLHLVDLAGSERVYKREGGTTQRTRSEGKHINLSLHHLEQVIISLRHTKGTSKTQPPSSSTTTLTTTTNTLSSNNPQPHIPYRNSMLTSVLRGSLGGNCKSVFIATLNPEAEFIDESISTCRFMQRCSEVTVDIGINQEYDPEKRVIKLLKEKEELIQLTQIQQQKMLELEQQNQLLLLQQSPIPLEQIDINKCEELVEQFLLTGGDDDNTASEQQEDHDQDTENLSLTKVLNEIRTLGVDHALCCLTMLKDHALFASNTAAELQELIDKQKLTMDLLEKHLLDQKQEAEQLKQQVQTLSNNTTTNETRGGDVTTQLKQKRLSSADTLEVGHPSDVDEKEQVVQKCPPPSSSSSSSSSTSPPPPPPPLFPKSLSSMRSNNSLTATVEKDPTKSASDLIRQRTELLKKGSLFVKHGRRGRPHVRFVWCTNDLEYLQYREIGQSTPSASIPTRSLTRVLTGQQTKVFNRLSKQDKDIFCFSLEYQVTPDTIRTLDLEVEDGEKEDTKQSKRNEWVEALQFLVKLKTVQQQRSTSLNSSAATTKTIQY